MNLDLFGAEEQLEPWREELYPEAVVLRRYALERDRALLAALKEVLKVSPWRDAYTPGGLKMSVQIASCGEYGTSNKGDYGMHALDPITGRPWPAMPEVFRQLGVDAAAEAGFPGFEPNMVHVNRYAPGAKLGLHQDRGESDLHEPIVSVSLGLPAVFKMGGVERFDPIKHVPVEHGDIVVWGGTSRMRYHGVLPVRDDVHPLTGACRVNLTIRRVRPGR